MNWTNGTENRRRASAGVALYHVGSLTAMLPKVGLDDSPFLYGEDGLQHARTRCVRAPKLQLISGGVRAAATRAARHEQMRGHFMRRNVTKANITFAVKG